MHTVSVRSLEHSANLGNYLEGNAVAPGDGSLATNERLLPAKTAILRWDDGRAGNRAVVFIWAPFAVLRQLIDRRRRIDSP